MPSGPGAAGPGRPLALPRSSRASEWARLRADTPLTLTADEVMRLQSPQRPDLARRGRRDLPAAVAPALALRRRDAGAVQGDAALPRSPRTRARCPTSSASPARSRSASRPRRASSRRCSRAGRTRPRSTSSPPTASCCPTPSSSALGLMERKGFPGELRHRRAAALPRRHQGRQAQRRARRVYSHLVYDVVPGEEIVVDRPDILIVEGLNVLQPARLPRDGTRDPLRVRLLRLLGLSRRRRGRPAPLVRRAASCACARPPSATRSPTSASTPSSPTTEAIEIADGLWNRINLAESAREHPADPPARRA